LGSPVYALDASTVDLCLSIFKNVLDILDIEVGAFYVMDRGYLDYKRLFVIASTPAFWITRAKKNSKFNRIYSEKITPKEKKEGVRCDQTVVLTGSKLKKDYPEKLRRIKFYDEGKQKMYVFITNNFILKASEIANLYKQRWQIELFFKWVKQHLKIKVFWGVSENAVKTQIWIAVVNYLIMAIIKKKLNLEKSLYEILQISSVSLFDKTPLTELFLDPIDNEVEQRAQQALF